MKTIFDDTVEETKGKYILGVLVITPMALGLGAMLYFAGYTHYKEKMIDLETERSKIKCSCLEESCRGDL